MLAFGLWAAQLVAAVSALVAAMIEIESILVFGPVLSLIGLAMAAITRRLESWTTIAYGLSAPLACAFGATLIALNDWGPPAAGKPIVLILMAYQVLAVPLAIGSFFQIRCWRLRLPDDGRRVWQFSMKTMLIWMSAVCLFAALGQFFVRQAVDNEVLVFGSFATAACAFAAIIVWRSVGVRRTPTSVEARSQNKL
jgi:hypothetical protein